MTHIKWHDISGAGLDFAAPAIEPVTGLRPFVAHPAVAIYRSQDTIAAQSRRIVCSWGLRGDAEWRVPNTNPDLALLAAQTHPNATSWYTVARARVDVTPGCFFRWIGAYVPSGETQANHPVGPDPRWRPDGAQGRVRVTVTWYDRDGSDESTAHDVELEGSTLQYGAEDVSAGGLWRTLREFEVPLIAPPGVPEWNITELHRWSRSIAAEITVEVQGSPRIVDSCIYEVPWGIALDRDDPDDDAFAVSHLYA